MIPSEAAGPVHLSRHRDGPPLKDPTFDCFGVRATRTQDTVSGRRSPYLKPGRPLPHDYGGAGTRTHILASVEPPSAVAGSAADYLHSPDCYPCVLCALSSGGVTLPALVLEACCSGTPGRRPPHGASSPTGGPTRRPRIQICRPAVHPGVLTAASTTGRGRTRPRQSARPGTVDQSLW